MSDSGGSGGNAPGPPPFALKTYALVELPGEAEDSNYKRRMNGMACACACVCVCMCVRMCVLRGVRME